MYNTYMPIITEINPQKRKKDRFNIYLDGEYAGSMNAETMVLSGIKCFAEISENDFLEILQRDNEKYAFDLALKAIAVKRRTIFETKEYLLKKEIDEAAAEAAIKKTLEYGYLNDLDYAKEFISYYINAEKFGRMTVAYKLKTKGVDDDTIEKAMSAYTEEIEYQIAQRHYGKLVDKYRSLPPFERRGKISRALTAKGFGFDVISSLLSTEDDE